MKIMFFINLDKIDDFFNKKKINIIKEIKNLLIILKVFIEKIRQKMELLILFKFQFIYK